MSPWCCCFRKRSSGRRSGRYQAKETHGKSKRDDLQSPLSCNSFISEYYDAQESFAAPDGTSPACSTNGTPRHSESPEKYTDQVPHANGHTNGHNYQLGAGRPADAIGAFNPPVGSCPATAGGAATAPPAMGPTVVGEQWLDGNGYLAGTSETSEEPLQAAGGPISRLAACLSILDNIRMPGAASGSASALAAGGSSSGAAGGGGAAAAALPGGGGSEGGGSVRQSTRRLGKLEPGCTLRRRDMSLSVFDVREAWDECDEARGGEGAATSGRPFMVRGPDYMKTRVKVSSRAPLYRLLAVDVVTSETKMTHLARNFNLQSLLRPAVDPHLPPLLIITVMVPMYPATLFGANDGPSQSLVYYFGLPPDFNAASFENQAALGLLRRFASNGREADGSPTRDRFKLIPRVVNVDEWAQKGPLSPPEHKLLATYNQKPILTRPQHIFFNGPGYLEVDMDVHTYPFLARKAFTAYFSRLKEVIFENAFVIQGNSPEELPEQVLASVRLYRIDFLRSRPLRDFLTPPGADNTTGLGGGGGGGRRRSQTGGVGQGNGTHAPPPAVKSPPATVSVAVG